LTAENVVPMVLDWLRLAPRDTGHLSFRDPREQVGCFDQMYLGELNLVAKLLDCGNYRWQRQRVQKASISDGWRWTATIMDVLGTESGCSGSWQMRRHAIVGKYFLARRAMRKCGSRSRGGTIRPLFVGCLEPLSCLSRYWAASCLSFLNILYC
jgi:hypothetical protein